MKNLPFRSMVSALAIALFFVSSRAYSTPGDLYVTYGGSVYKFTSAGDRSTFAFGIYQPVALAFDRAGNLFVANSGAGGCIPEVECPPKPGTIIRIMPDGTQSTFVTLQSSQLLGLAFDGAGNLFVSTGNSIVKVAANGTQSTFASQLHGAWPMAFDIAGNLFVGLNPIGSSSIAKFAPDGSSTTFVTLTGSSSSITGLAFGAGGDLYVRAGSSILKIKPDGSRTTFATNDRFNYPVAFDASGILFAGLTAWNSTEPAIVQFTSAG